MRMAQRRRVSGQRLRQAATSSGYEARVAQVATKGCPVVLVALEGVALKEHVRARATASSPELPVAGRAG